MPWHIAPGHTTWDSERNGSFPLCEGCWIELGTPEARLPYYRALFDAWGADGRPDDGGARWDDIQVAVLAGK